MPMVGRWVRVEYMFVAVEDVVDEAVDDGGLADCLVAQKHDLVFEEGRYGAPGEI